MRNDGDEKASENKIWGKIYTQLMSNVISMEFTVLVLWTLSEGIKRTFLKRKKNVRSTSLERSVNVVQTLTMF